MNEFMGYNKGVIPHLMSQKGGPLARNPDLILSGFLLAKEWQKFIFPLHYLITFDIDHSLLITFVFFLYCIFLDPHYELRAANGDNLNRGSLNIKHNGILQEKRT